MSTKTEVGSCFALLTNVTEFISLDKSLVAMAKTSPPTSIPGVTDYSAIV